MVRRFLGAILHPAVMAPFVVAYTLMLLAPASFWYSPRTLRVTDIYAGETPSIILDREVKRGFDGLYVSETRFLDGPKAGEIACNGSQHVAYRGGLFKPLSMDLVQFNGENDRCAQLPAGTYYTSACWYVLRPFWGLVPEKKECIASTPHAVLEPPKS